MSRCKNDVLLSKIGFVKVDSKMEVEFTVMESLPDCRNINAKNYIEVADSATFDQFIRPTNVFECMPEGCSTSGTLTVTGTSATYKAQFDATDFASGIITAYIKGTVNKVTVSSDSAFKNADVYTPTKGEEGADGFTPIIVDLSQTPASVTGEGWTASSAGAYIKFEGTNFSLSSISIFDSLEDFETTDVVKIGCLTEIEGADEIDAAEATCFGGGYDTSDLTFERTITGKAITPNAWKLDPLLGKGETTEGFKSVTVEKQIVESADKKYGQIVLTDMSEDECGFLSISIADSCNVTDAALTRLSMPILLNIDSKNYVVIKGEDGVTNIYFNKSLVGMDVVVSYPQTAQVEERIANIDNVDGKRTRMAYKYKQTDGVEIYRVYNNVLVTSFPHTINEDETEFEFTVNIQKDSEGHYYREWRLL